VEWFRRWFNEDYLALYSGRDQSEADLQVEFLLSLLGSEALASRRFCDLACGSGRHLASLVERGANAYGIDLSETLLQSANPQLFGRLIRADLRSLPFRSASFDVLTSFFTSFGYFDTLSEHQAVLLAWGRMLNPGGLLFMDLPNRARVISELVASELRDQVKIERSIVETADGTRVTKKIAFLTPDSNKDYSESVFLFSKETIESLLRQAGFAEIDLYGELDGSDFSANSSRMYILGRK